MKEFRALAKVRPKMLTCTFADIRIDPDYPEAAPIAQSYVRAAPERLVWGSDWPHPGPEVKPDGARLFDLLALWAPEEAVRNRILVENPDALHGFPKSA